MDPLTTQHFLHHFLQSTSRSQNGPVSATLASSCRPSDTGNTRRQDTSCYHIVKITISVHVANCPWILTRRRPYSSIRQTNSQKATIENPLLGENTRPLLLAFRICTVHLDKTDGSLRGLCCAPHVQSDEPTSRNSLHPD